jgi:uncharacterized coiled-coil protein SlyX
MLIVCLAGSWAVSGQSLADLAKKEEERRKSTPQPAKVYTNKDLKGQAESSAPGTPDKPAGDSKDVAKDNEAKGGAKDSKASKETDASKEPVKDQAYWAKTLKTLRDQLARDQDYADAMQTRINSLTTDFVNRDDPAQRAVIETNRQKSVAELARLTKSVQDDKKALADFLEEARRAGIPPGWLR